MSVNLEKYQHYGKKFEELLRPASFPIAIKLVKDKSEILSNFKRPKSDLNVQTFVCQTFKMVRSYGWTMIITEEDCACKLARGIYGWDPMSEEAINFANQFSIGLYSKNLETAKKLQEHLYILKEKCLGLVISPLTRTKIEPDVVQIYCNPAQATRLIQAYLYIKGGVLDFTSAGRVGSCHEGIIKTIQTDEPQLVILGNGDRVWGGAEDTEVMFSIPKSKLDSVIEGLESTHKAGLRYPIPKYMNYTPGFQTSFEKKAIKKAGGTIVKN
ncbi:MAG: DUF169 domain-containing protein [Candidatus Lokiarchaeota archaeon]|nr:DUF169 domain-containing protein [Candidatus Lokiarchaeota archaeon]